MIVRSLTTSEAATVPSAVNGCRPGLSSSLEPLNLARCEMPYSRISATSLPMVASALAPATASVCPPSPGHAGLNGVSRRTVMTSPGNARAWSTQLCLASAPASGQASRELGEVVRLACRGDETDPRVWLVHLGDRQHGDQRVDRGGRQRS
jgi:hypothetical protein